MLLYPGTEPGKNIKGGENEHTINEKKNDKEK
jgi:hypothetical protein